MTAGCRGGHRPCRVQGEALLQWRAFTEADLAQPNLRSAPKCVPRRGTPWEGGARHARCCWSSTWGRVQAVFWSLKLSLVAKKVQSETDKGD